MSQMFEQYFDISECYILYTIINEFFLSQEEQNRGKPNWEHLTDELHVLLTVEDTENRATLKLARAVEEVKKLLVPVVRKFRLLVTSRSLLLLPAHMCTNTNSTRCSYISQFYLELRNTLVYLSTERDYSHHQSEDGSLKICRVIHSDSVVILGIVEIINNPALYTRVALKSGRHLSFARYSKATTAQEPVFLYFRRAEKSTCATAI